jgi:uncharacterized membrane protein
MVAHWPTVAPVDDLGREAPVLAPTATPPEAGQSQDGEPAEGQAELEGAVLVGEDDLVVAGGHAHAAQGVVDPEQLGRLAVDLDSPLGVPGVGEHEQAVTASLDRDPHPGLVALTIVTDLDGITAITGDPKAMIGLVIGLGILGTGVAYILYYIIVDHLGAITASSATYIPPVVALAMGWLLVKEPLDILDAAAVLLILAGVAVLRSRSPRPTSAP